MGRRLRRIVPGSVESRILACLSEADGFVSSVEVLAAAKADTMTVRRMLGELTREGRIVRRGRTRSTRYALARPRQQKVAQR